MKTTKQVTCPICDQNLKRVEKQDSYQGRSRKFLVHVKEYCKTCCQYEYEWDVNDVQPPSERIGNHNINWYDFYLVTDFKDERNRAAHAERASQFYDHREAVLLETRTLFQEVTALGILDRWKGAKTDKTELEEIQRKVMAWLQDNQIKLPLTYKLVFTKES